MLEPRTEYRRWLACTLLGWLCLGMMWSTVNWPASHAMAQEADPATEDPLGPFVAPVDEDAVEEDVENLPAPDIRISQEEGINFFALLVKGGWFMIPIGMLSVLVVTIAIERAIALRRACTA